MKSHKIKQEEEKGTTEDEMVGWHHRLNGQAPGDGDGQGSLACCSPWGCKELEQLNNDKIKTKLMKDLKYSL